MSKFLLIDDHPMFREALRGAIEIACPPSEVCEATTIFDALTQIGHAKPSFDLVLLDLTLPGVERFEGLREIRSHFAELPIIVVSSLDGADVIQGALSYGAQGYVPKSGTKAEIASAVREVLSGAIHLPECLRGQQVALPKSGRGDFLARLATLTPQQERVLEMLRQGLLNKQIAHELDVCERTVKLHVSEILRKLGASSRTRVVADVSEANVRDLPRN